MKVSFYKEEQVDIEIVEKVIKQLLELPTVMLDFDKKLTNFKVTDEMAGSQSKKELDVLKAFFGIDEADKQSSKIFDEFIEEELNIKKEEPQPWFEKYFLKIKREKPKSDFIIHFHDRNEDGWYSRVGFYGKKRIISMATDNETWYELPNKEAAIAHECISSILIAHACNTEKEYLELPKNMGERYNSRDNSGSMIDPLWIEKTKRYDASIGEFIENDTYKAGSKLMQLKIKSADLEDELLEFLKEKKANEYLIRDVVAGMQALATSNSNVTKRKLNKQKASDIEFITAKKSIRFTNLNNREVKLSPQTFVLYAAHFLAKKIAPMELREIRNALNFMMPGEPNIDHFEKVFQTVKKEYKNGDVKTEMPNFRKAKSDIKKLFVKHFSGNPEYAEHYLINDNGEIPKNLSYSFDNDFHDKFESICRRTKYLKKYYEERDN